MYNCLSLFPSVSNYWNRCATPVRQFISDILLELGLGLGLGFVLEPVHQQRVPVALRTDNSPLQKAALMHACFGGLGNEPSESGR